MTPLSGTPRKMLDVMRSFDPPMMEAASKIEATTTTGYTNAQSALGFLSNGDFRRKDQEWVIASDQLGWGGPTSDLTSHAKALKKLRRGLLILLRNGEKPETLTTLFYLDILLEVML
ncbi:hypothetical protein F0562_007267 [Nyssa sinensis]|uniref:Uncharacterized protein n=1 Tax=Nyssa sinensis TaxID=561372 RepID=A0A5J5A2X3_9ASTE|nr:hypothetical protein F0562_007267 [Nyssa sinensis]